MPFIWEVIHTSANLFLGHIRHLEDLSEAALLSMVTASDEDAARNNGVLRFALEQLVVIRDTEEQLGRLSSRFADVLRVAQCGDLAVGSLKRLVRLVVVRLVVSARQLSHAQASIAEADLGC